MGNQTTSGEIKPSTEVNEPLIPQPPQTDSETTTVSQVTVPIGDQKVEVTVTTTEKKNEGIWSFFQAIEQKVDQWKEMASKEIANTSLLPLEMKKSIGELYDLLMEYGQDITLSDLFVGYLMLSSHYRHTHPYNQKYAPYEEMEDAVYYMKFANAVYGWKLIDGILKNDITSVLSGFGKKLSTSNEAEIAHNVASYTKYLELSGDTIIHANWFSEYMCPAHLVCVSKEKKKIIISIRGTMDAHDCLSDVICTYGPLEPGLCHKGMYQCAKNKLAIIEEHLLKSLEIYPDYGVAVTGHSLGAGTAGILIYLLKKKYPHLDIIGRLYGCPSIFDIENSRALSPFVTCFVNRNDIIPRLTFGSLYDLKAMIKTLLKDNPQSSQRIWQIVSAGGNFPKFIQEKMDESIGKAGYDIEKIKSLKTSEKLYQPGKIIYIYIPKESNVSTNWYGEVSDPLLFDEIILSSHMFTDHFPWEYEDNLKHTVEKHKSIQININVDGEKVSVESVEVSVNTEQPNIEVGVGKETVKVDVSTEDQNIEIKIQKPTDQ